VALLVNGALKSAISLERLTRRKFDGSFPALAIDYVLNAQNLTPSDIDCVVFFESPFLKLQRQEKVSNQNIALSKKYTLLFQAEYYIQKYFGKEIEIHYSEHHLSHLLHSYYQANFKQSCFLIVDGVGEVSCSLSGYIDEKSIESFETDLFPHSLGLYYSAFTQYLGFKANSDEYKVMGLAAYGRPKFTDKLKNTFSNTENNRPMLNLDYFTFQANQNSLFTEALVQHLGIKPRDENEEITQTHKDLAASVQKVLEDELVNKTQKLKRKYPDVDNLVLGGGVALNCLANLAIKRCGAFKNVFVPYACGDEGGAIGAAFYGARKHGLTIKKSTPYLGKVYSQTNNLDQYFLTSRPAESETIASLLKKGAIVGLFSEGAEFGPRSLGARSILAHPNLTGMKAKINKHIKLRENFRPLAPVIIEKYGYKYFKNFYPSPYMTMVFESNLIAQQKIPQALHVDGTARVQSVNDPNMLLYQILMDFNILTDIPALINTSMNLNTEPIVETELDAFFFFVRSKIDYLVLNDTLYAITELKPEYYDFINSYYKDYRHANRDGYTF
tara:strand:- start:26640 stop:28310 length:1671 start_codon:yes stop_codon:yes gene_type:complete